MPLTYAAALEAFSLVVTVDALIVLAADINGRAVTSADGMAIIVLCVAAAVQGFRVISLTRLAGPTMIRDLDDAMLLFSGVYLVSIWATLHIGINIMAPSRKVFILVGMAMAKPCGIVLIETGKSQRLHRLRLRGRQLISHTGR